MDNLDKVQEWIEQAEYDLETARVMFRTGRFIYCVFMCHLAIEKTLKGLFQNALNEIPPKVHSLVYLVQTQKLDLPENIKQFLENLDRVSVPTRYPSELRKLLVEYSKERTKKIFEETEGVLKCLKITLKKR